MARDVDAIRERCRSLAGFMREAWHVLEPTQLFVPNWHIEAICEHLEALTRGQINRLLVNIWPGASKSMIVSVLWEAWEWGPCNMPSLRFLTTAFSEGPVKRDTRKCRDLIASEWYQTLWPHVKLVRTAELSFANSATGSREGVPFTALTSQRGDRLVIDDPHSVKTAESDAVRTETTRLFLEGALNRLNDQEKSAIAVIMQRLRTDDLSGVIISRHLGYEHLCLPMEFERERRCHTSIGFIDPRIYDGESGDAQRFPPETIEKLKSEMGSYAWAGQYQQRPAPREGGMFKRAWFKTVRAAPAAVRASCRGWDLAATEKTQTNNPAFTVGLRLSVDAKGCYFIEDVQRDRGSPAMVEQMILATAKSDSMARPGTRVSIPQDPGQAAKSQVMAFSKLLAGFDIRFTPESGDKEERATPVSAQAEAGNIFIVEGPWNEAFLSELAVFPAANHKDQVDALSRAFAELLVMTRQGGSAIGMPIQAY